MTEITLNYIKNKIDKTHSFGLYNNWIIPNLILCGPFCGLDGINYKTDQEVIDNLTKILSTGIDTFICLQKEISPQDGTIGTVNNNFIWAFPKFCNYSYYIKNFLSTANCNYIYLPIKDNSAPSLQEFSVLMDSIFSILEKDKKIFIHCAGGHGRTGMVASALISLLENTSVDSAIERNQRRHDSRVKLDGRQKVNSIVISPSTPNQRNLVELYINSKKLCEYPSFQIKEVLENKNLRISGGGMSAEIGFAKYYAFRRKLVYTGWDINIRMVTPNIIINTLNYIVDNVKKIESRGCMKPILYSPGYLSVSYMVELCNLIYLPSQFLIGFNEIKQLKAVLQTLYNNKIKAYAVAGYDSCISHCLVAWIKFIEMPPQYDKLIKNYLHTDKLLLAGVYDKNHETFGENIIYQYGSQTECIQSKNIYFLHIYSCYGDKITKDWTIFKKLAIDFKSENMGKEKCTYVGDWESALDFMDETSFYPSYYGNFYKAGAKDTLPLYKLSYQLSRKFMKINNISINGIVANPYIMNSPTYETHYGYLGFTYWAGNPNVDEYLFQLIKNDLPENGTLWLNDQNNQKINLYHLFENIKIIHINNSSPMCIELANWLEKNQPRVYPTRDYINIYQLKKIMEKCDIKLIGFL
jgi:protein-tyrosine phosphatase